MAATTATVQILKQTDSSVTFKVVGTGAETAATLIDSSTLNGATGLSNLLAITKLEWTINADKTVTLLWDGASVDVDIVKLNRNGSLKLNREMNIKLENNASGPTGDILVTSSDGIYTLFLEAEKIGSGWYRVGQYN